MLLNALSCCLSCPTVALLPAFGSFTSMNAPFASLGRISFLRHSLDARIIAVTMFGACRFMP